MTKDVSGDDHCPQKLLALELRFQHQKHVTTLCLTGVGGVITLAGSIFADVVDKSTMWMAAASFLIGAVAAYLASDHLVKGLTSGKDAQKTVDRLEYLANGLFAFGCGLFTSFAFMNI